MRRCLWLMSTVLACATPAFAQIDEEELEERLQALEDFAIDTESKMGHKGIINSLDSLEAELGGYLVTRYQRYETDSDSINYFDGPLVYLTFQAKPSDRWSVQVGHIIGQGINIPPGAAEVSPAGENFGNVTLLPPALQTLATAAPAAQNAVTLALLDPTTQNIQNRDTAVAAAQSAVAEVNRLIASPIRGPNSLTTGALVDPSLTQDLNFSARAIIEYRHHDAFNVQFGRMTTPIGLLTRELYPQTFVVAGYPTFNDVLVGTGFTYGTFLNGVNLHGKIAVGNNQIISYNAFHGAFIDPFSAETPTQPLGLQVDNQSGGRISWGLSDQTFDIGLNYIHGRREDFFGGNSFDVLGLDLFYDSRWFQARFEYFDSTEDEVRQFSEGSVFGSLLQIPIGADMPDRKGWYFEPVFHVTPKFDIGFRYDIFEIGSLPSPVLAQAEQLAAAVSSTGLGNLDINLNPYPFIGEIVEANIAFVYRPTTGIKLTLGGNRRIYREFNDFEVDATYFSVDVGF